nr:hypothetical protein [Tanacetum cinerariifolium]
MKRSSNSDPTLRTPREERYERRGAKKREREEEVESITEVQSFRSKKPKMRVIIPTERILISGIKRSSNSDPTLRTPREERYERRGAKKREREEEVESITEVQSFRSKKPKMRVIIPTERILISGIKVNFKIRRNMRN